MPDIWASKSLVPNVDQKQRAMRQEAVIQLVDWMYIKEVTVSRADLVDLLGAADYFQAVLLFIWNYVNRFFIRSYIHGFHREFFKPVLIRNCINRFFIQNYINAIFNPELYKPVFHPKLHKPFFIRNYTNRVFIRNYINSGFSSGII
jgi:hypothetical protein